MPHIRKSVRLLLAAALAAGALSAAAPAATAQTCVTGPAPGVCYYQYGPLCWRVWVYYRVPTYAPGYQTVTTACDPMPA